MFNWDWINIKTGILPRFCDIEILISYLQLLPEISIMPRAYTINTCLDDGITLSQIKCTGYVSDDDIQIMKNYLMELFPKLNIVDIYYVTTVK